MAVYSSKLATWYRPERIGMARPVLLGVIASMVLALAGCGDDPMAPTSAASPTANPEASAGATFDSPQAVYEAAKQSQLDEDWGALFDAYAPDSQDRLAGSMAFGAAMLASEEAKNVLRKYGINDSVMPETPTMTDMAKLQAIVKDMDDKRAFFVELASSVGGTDSTGGQMKEQLAASRKAQADAKLTDVEITGSTATGYQELTVKGNPLKVPVFFTKIDGSWYLHQPTMAEAQEMGRKVGEQMGRKRAGKE